jgi:hypothetical protein
VTSHLKSRLERLESHVIPEDRERPDNGDPVHFSGEDGNQHIIRDSRAGLAQPKRQIRPTAASPKHVQIVVTSRGGILGNAVIHTHEMPTFRPMNFHGPAQSTFASSRSTKSP